jgi:hypothetical protein
VVSAARLPAKARAAPVVRLAATVAQITGLLDRRPHVTGSTKVPMTCIVPID